MKKLELKNQTLYEMIDDSKADDLYFDEGRVLAVRRYKSAIGGLPAEALMTLWQDESEWADYKNVVGRTINGVKVHAVKAFVDESFQVFDFYGKRIDGLNDVKRVGGTFKMRVDK